MCEVAERLVNIGRAEGYAEGCAEVVKAMIELGRTPVDIAEFTGIDIQEVKKIIQI